jgi:hypothetical protein
MARSHRKDEPMKHDLFEFNMDRMTHGDRAWRVLFLLSCIGVLLVDLLVWRPG